MACPKNEIENEESCSECGTSKWLENNNDNSCNDDATNEWRKIIIR